MSEPTAPPAITVSNDRFEEKGGSRSRRWLWGGSLLVLAGTAILLRAQGHRWWCECGRLFLWSGDIWSSHNSQHLFDPYSFSHLLHGLIFYGGLVWSFPRMSLAGRLLLALGIEAGWELFENTDFVIQRYREGTIALEYYGDTILNSLSDILTCGAGFFLARSLKFWGSLAVFLVVEVVMLVMIRDSLLLNVVMLIYPSEAIKAWQMGV